MDEMPNRIITVSRKCDTISRRLVWEIYQYNMDALWIYADHVPLLPASETVRKWMRKVSLRTVHLREQGTMPVSLTKIGDPENGIIVYKHLYKHLTSNSRRDRHE